MQQPIDSITTCQGNRIRVCAARPPDAEAIVSIIRLGFEPEVLDSTIYGCSGIVMFIQQLLLLPEQLTSRCYLVAWLGNEPVGVLDASLSDTAFVNYISVLPTFRHQGVGRALMACLVVRASERSRATHVVLDVLESNVAARRWYQGLGFSPQALLHWWAADLPSSEKPVHPVADVKGFPFAVCSHRRYGFANLQVVTAKAVHTVGLLGARYFRIGPQGTWDDDLLNALRDLDRQRQALIHADSGSCMAPLTKRRLASLQRMSLPITALLPSDE